MIATAVVIFLVYVGLATIIGAGIALAKHTRPAVDVGEPADHQSHAPESAEDFERHVQQALALANPEWTAIDEIQLARFRRSQRSQS